MVNGWLKQKIKEWLFSDGAKPAVVKRPGEHTVIIKSDRIVFPDLSEQITKGISGSEVDTKITTHKGDASAHHAAHLKTLADHPLTIIPTMDDAHIPAAIARDTEVDSKITAHGTGSKHRWTADKLLKGAGAGADPTEIDVPTGDMTKAVYDPDADGLIETALNRVKLPSPSASDYITPSAVLASSESANWISPTGTVSVGGWTNPAYAYDGDTTTGATRETPVEGYTPFLVLSIPKTYSNKLRWYAYCQSPYVNSIDIDVLKDEAWVDVFTGGFTSYTWVEASFTAGFVTQIRARFYGGSYGGTANWREVELWCLSSGNAIDDALATSWRPSPVNEIGAWCRGDMGALKICSGCRIYWGADANYRPTAYRIEVSENGTDWTTVVTETTAPGASAWKEYSWNARYARYIRMIVDTHGATGTEVFEADYYSRITDRVASEHGHGSGVTPHLKVKHSQGHPAMVRGQSLRDKVRDLPSLIEWLDFMLRD